MQHVTVAKMKLLNSPSWQKSACFGLLFDTLSSLVPAHSVTDVVSLVSTELPLNTIVAFQEAQSVSKSILKAVINIVNLELLVFLNSSGSSVSIIDFSDL